MQPNAVVEWKDIIGKQFPFSEMETVRVVIIHAKVGPAEPPTRGLSTSHIRFLRISK